MKEFYTVDSSNNKEEVEKFADELSKIMIWGDDPEVIKIIKDFQSQNNLSNEQIIGVVETMVENLKNQGSEKLKKEEEKTIQEKEKNKDMPQYIKRAERSFEPTSKWVEKSGQILDSLVNKLRQEL
jgi:hypothetical protein